MRFYLVLGLMGAGLFGGYRASETCRQLDDFHHRLLESSTATTDHTVFTAAGVLRE